MSKRSPEATVRGFFEQIRSGQALHRAAEFLRPEVLAHQSEPGPAQTLTRSPQNYAEHVIEIRNEFGPFELQLDECLADGDKVYLRWRQRSAAGITPVKEQVASAVYRVEDGCIAEYWIQVGAPGLA